VFTVLEYILTDLIRLAFPLAVGLLSMIFYIKKKKTGMLLIAVAFFLSAFLTILFGATMIQYLFTTGWNPYTYAFYSLVFGFGFEAASAILMVIGLYLLYKDLK
jgi:hypothetical protein